jgi:hypothetical protein
MIDLEAEFEKHDDEYIKFENIKDPPCKRPDLCAFLLLDRLLPGDQDIVSASEHDEIYLKIEPEELAKVATSEDILYLTRCGVRYDSDTDSLAMFT